MLREAGQEEDDHKRDWTEAGKQDGESGVLPHFVWTTERRKRVPVIGHADAIRQRAAREPDRDDECEGHGRTAALVVTLTLTLVGAGPHCSTSTRTG